tara:strand:+ start:1634 stop:1777 length:144 start_codon:yes stop_codon:yes gene_type:complete
MEMVAVVSFFGFMNRFNDNLAVTLKDKPHRFAVSHGLESQGWSAEPA